MMLLRKGRSPFHNTLSWGTGPIMCVFYMGPGAPYGVYLKGLRPFSVTSYIGPQAQYNFLYGGARGHYDATYYGALPHNI